MGVDTTPPAIQVTGPFTDGSVIESNLVEFRGATEWGSEVFSGPFPATTDEYGEWSILLVLEPGENGVVFTARDAAGNEKSVRITVEYAPPTVDIPESATATTPSPRRPDATTTTTIAPKPKAVVTSVEQWRPLVEKHFSAGNVETALRVMACESGGNPDAMNRSRQAAGLFQHLLKYWGARAERAGYPGGDIFDPETNIAASAWLAENHGWNHWTCY